MSELNTISAHVPENACPELDPGWIPVSRLREARQFAVAPTFTGRFGGRRKVRKGHAPTQKLRAHPDSIETGCALAVKRQEVILG